MRRALSRRRARLDSVEVIAAGKSYFGATIGRYANRIRRGSFVIEDAATSSGATRRQQPARRRSRFRPALWSSAARAGARRLLARLALREPGRRRRLPRRGERALSYTLAETMRSRSTTRRRPTRPTRESHQSRVLQSCRRGDIRPSARDRRKRYTPIDDSCSHRHDRAGRGHAVRLPSADRHRRAHRATRYSARACGRLRPQFRPRSAGTGALRWPPSSANRFRAAHEGAHHRARNPVLLGQFPRRQRPRQGGAAYATARGCASRRNTSPTRRTSRLSLRRCCGRATVYRQTTMYRFDTATD